ncbi:kinase-like domain-containing protein [Obelidium mucronatum]|nr:kinase-like domain-containing protein [Obelidium mucronatum]
MGSDVSNSEDQPNGDSPRHHHHRYHHHNHHHHRQHTKSSALVKERKLKQGRLLLVSLLENFCMLYDQSPERNKRLFFVLCKQLSAMGIIDSEDFLDEISAVRGAYKRAFKELVMQAMQAIRDEGLPRALPSTLSNSDGDGASRDSENEGSDRISHTMHHYSYSSDNIYHENLSQPMEQQQSAYDLSEILDLQASRYLEDFEEVRPLGKGGFGQVWCVRNKLDGMEYAVKRVKLRAKEGGGVAKILREVKVQARMSHQNVVRYFSCWLEHASPAAKVQDAGDDDIGDGLESTTEDFTGDPQSMDYQSSVENYSTDFTSRLRNETKMKAENRPSNSAKPRTGLPRELTLFIQMELCGNTLQQYLNYRNKAIYNTNFCKISDADLVLAINPIFCTSVIRDMCEGLVYIHSQGCIHRDIAPKNIFWVPKPFSGSNTSINGYSIESMSYWKIGDFGLVTLSDVVEDDGQSFVSRESTASDINPNGVLGTTKTRTTGIGTVTYASPEQLAPSESYSYTSKSDMFSVGIVLFELLHPLGTGMERAQTLTNLRLGVLPEEFVKRFPKEATLILSLMNKNPEHRPCARETLDVLILSAEKPTASTGNQPSLPDPAPENQPQESDIDILATQSRSRRPSKQRLAFVEAITNTIKNWIHHPHKEDMHELGSKELMEELSNPVKALRMVVDAHKRAEKAEQEANLAKLEIDKLRAKIAELETKLKE